jgi:hypothetical protein
VPHIPIEDAAISRDSLPLASRGFRVWGGCKTSAIDWREPIRAFNEAMPKTSNTEVTR